MSQPLCSGFETVAFELKVTLRGAKHQPTYEDAYDAPLLEFLAYQRAIVCDGNDVVAGESHTSGRAPYPGFPVWSAW